MLSLALVLGFRWRFDDGHRAASTRRSPLDFGDAGPAVSRGERRQLPFSAWQTPDNVHALLDCGTFCINFNVQFMNGHDEGGAGYYGTGGTILQRGGKMVHVDTKGKVLADWPTPGEGEWHMRNFLECVKSRKTPNSPVGVAHKVLAGAFLANESFLSGRRVTWDVKTETKGFRVEALCFANREDLLPTAVLSDPRISRKI